jgi:hypothetical protein
MLFENIKFVQGDQLEIPFQILDSELFLVSANWGALFQVRKYTHSQPVISVQHVNDSASGVTFTTDTSGKVIVPGSLTRNVEPGLYQFQLQFTSSENQSFTPFSGRIEVLQDLAFIPTPQIAPVISMVIEDY